MRWLLEIQIACLGLLIILMVGYTNIIGIENALVSNPTNGTGTSSQSQSQSPIEIQTSSVPIKGEGNQQEPPALALSPSQRKAALHLTNESRPVPPQMTLGAFVHVGKTGGSTLSALLRNGCSEYAPKPCIPERVSKGNETAVSKLTTYYHDFRRGPREKAFNIFKRPVLHDFYLFTTRDPIERLVSSYLYTHPSNKEAAEFPYFKMTDLFSQKMKELGNNETAVHEYFLHNVFKQTYKEEANEELYACFPTLNEYAALLDNAQDYREGNWRKFVKQGDCANVAKLTIHNMVNDAMMHHLYNLPFITWNLGTGLVNKTIMTVRTEHLNDDWIEVNAFLGQARDTVQMPHARLKDSSKVDQPVKKILSQENRKKLCHAIEREYKVYLSIIESSVNLSPSEKDKTLQEARDSCPWLNLTLPGTLGQVYGKEWQDYCKNNDCLQSA
jgi:hypothetical protein